MGCLKCENQWIVLQHYQVYNYNISPLQTYPNITQTDLKHKISIINHLMISIQTFLLTILIPKT